MRLRMAQRFITFVLSSLFVVACSSSTTPGEVSADGATDAAVDTAVVPADGAVADGGASDGAKSDADGSSEASALDDCADACTRASSCGWAMPYGCSDWCGPSSFTPHLGCIAKAKDCAAACACISSDPSSCSSGGDASTDAHD
jgi:hypothetical protein